MLYECNIKLPGLAWTVEHTDQGFARRESVVNFSTLLEYGTADVTAVLGQYKHDERYERVIAVPFLVKSGTVVLEGPEEADVGRTISLAPGNYRLVAAQGVLDDDHEVIDLFFEPLSTPLEHSEILIKDDNLNPQTPLIETAGIAGED